MHYAVFVSTGPHSGALSKAYHFCKEALIQGNTIDLVFFYQDAVLIADKNTSLPEGDITLLEAWQNLHETYHFPMHLCSASARHYAIPKPPALGFEISGLGFWVSKAIAANSLVVYNGQENQPHQNPNKSIVALITEANPPNGNPRELLDQILAAAAFDQPVQVIFHQEGIHQLIGDLAPEWSMLADYGIEKVFVTELSASLYPDLLPRLTLPFELISLEQTEHVVQNSHWLISRSNPVFNSQASSIPEPALSEWTEVISESIADALGIALTESHRSIIRFAREYYESHQRLPGMRIFVKLCQTEINPELDSSTLNRLFLGKPLQHIAKLGGLPKPPHCV